MFPLVTGKPKVDIEPHQSYSDYELFYNVVLFATFVVIFRVVLVSHATLNVLVRVQVIEVVNRPSVYQNKRDDGQDNSQFEHATTLFGGVL